MNANKTARIVGALFLIAMVTSILGGSLIEAATSAPDLLSGVAADRTQVVAGVLLELVNAIAVVGIAVMMFPLFKTQHESLALGYVAFRVIEAAIGIAAVVSPLTLVALSQGPATAGVTDASSLQTIGAFFMEARAILVGQMLALFFGLAALLFYYLLYQTRLLPRFIPIWGLVGVVLVLGWNLLELFGISVPGGMILALPMILNEVFLGIWLILKGFNPSAIASEPAS